MIKKDIFNHDVKALLKASIEDKVHRFVMADNMIRGAVVKATRLVNEMQANHELGSIETLVLGQAYIAASLMASGLKGKDRISIQIKCDGPIGGLDVESNVFGEVRGFLKHPVISTTTSNEISGLADLIGEGDLNVTRYLEDAVTPYSGRIKLKYKTLAQDLAVYYLESEQIPTGFNLSVFFDNKERVKGAGGIFLQALPGVSDEQVVMAEALLENVEPIGEALANGKGAESLVLEGFEPLSPRFISSSRVEFFCRCSKDKMANYLSKLPGRDLSDLAQNGPFPVELRCHHCNSAYGFTREEIAQFLRSGS